MINQIGGVIGEMLETGQTTLKKGTKQAAKDFANSAKGQVAGGQSSPQIDQGTNEKATPQPQQKMSDQDRVEFLRNLYGKKNDGSKNVSGGTNQPQNPIQNALG